MSSSFCLFRTRRSLICAFFVSLNRMLGAGEHWQLGQTRMGNVDKVRLDRRGHLDGRVLHRQVAQVGGAAGRVSTDLGPAAAGQGGGARGQGRGDPGPDHGHVRPHHLPDEPRGDARRGPPHALLYQRRRVRGQDGETVYDIRKEKH